MIILTIIISLTGSILAMGRVNALRKELDFINFNKFELVIIFFGSWISFIGGLIVYFERKERVLLDFNFKRKR